MLVHNLGIGIYLRDAFSSQARVAQREMSRMTGKFRRESEMIGASMNRMEGRVHSAFKSIAGGAMVGYGLSRITKQSMAFNAAMAQVATIADHTTTNMSELRKEVLEQSAAFAKMPTDQAKGLYYIISSGFIQAADALQVLKPATSLAMVGLTDVETAADGLTSVLLSYNMAASDAAMVSDKLFETARYGKAEIEDIANTIGMVASAAATSAVSLDEMLAAYATLTLGGLSPSQAAQYERQILLGIARPTVRAAKTAREAGFDWSMGGMEQAGGFVPFLMDAAEKVGGGFKTNADGTKVVRNLEAFVSLFSGRQAYAGAAVLMQAHSRFAGALAGIKNPYYTDEHGMTVSNRMRAEAIMAKTLQFQWNRLKTGFATFAIALGTSVEPAFASFLRVFNQVLSGVTWAVTNIPLLGQALMFSGVALSVGLVTTGLRSLFKVIMNKRNLVMMRAVYNSMRNVLGIPVIRGGALRIATMGMLGLSAAAWGLRKAFENNIMGVRTFWSKLVVLGRALAEAKKNTKGFVTGVSTETAYLLQKNGLWKFFKNTVLIITRVKWAWFGFVKGFKEGVASITAGLRAFGRVLGNVLRATGLGGVVDKVKELYDSLTFSNSSILGAINFGEALGKIAAGLTAIWVAGKAVMVLGGLRSLFAGAAAASAAGGLAKGAMAGSGMGMMGGIGAMVGSGFTGARGVVEGLGRAIVVGASGGAKLLAPAAKAIAGGLGKGFTKGAAVSKLAGQFVGSFLPGIAMNMRGASGRGMWNWLIGDGMKVLRTSAVSNVAYMTGIQRGAANTSGAFFRSTARAAARSGSAISAAIGAGILGARAAVLSFITFLGSGMVLVRLRLLGLAIATAVTGPVGLWIAGITAALLALIALAKSIKPGASSQEPIAVAAFGNMMPRASSRHPSYEERTKNWDKLGHTTWEEGASPDALRAAYREMQERLKNQQSWGENERKMYDPMQRGMLRTSQDMAKLYAHMRNRGVALSDPQDDPGAYEKFLKGAGAVPDPAEAKEAEAAAMADATREGTRRGIQDAARSGAFMFDTGDAQGAKANPYASHISTLVGATAARAGAAGGRGAANELSLLGEIIGGTIGRAMQDYANTPVITIDGQVLNKIQSQKSKTAGERAGFGIPATVTP